MAKAPEETNLIQKYLAPLAGDAGLHLQDDAANLAPKPDKDLVLTCDTIVAGVHFLDSDNPFDIAVKAITVNLSDLVAKGAKPVGYLLALTFPGKPSEEWFDQFSSGLATQIKGELLGGDITVSKGGPLTITVTAIGEVPSGKMVKRIGAQIGDHVFVGGAIGTKAAGLKCALEPDWAERSKLTEDEIAELVEEYAAPILPNSDELAELIQSYASASLDISDGLVIDLNRLCSASKVGAEIEIASVPIDPVVTKLIEANMFSVVDAIAGGDDYIPLFTVSEKHMSAFMEAAKHLPFFAIGKITNEQKAVTFNNNDGSELLLDGRSGYDHFHNK